MKNKVILVSSDKLGNGDVQLGESVLETFFTLLKQREELPHAVFCMNRGVFTLTDDSFVSVHLKEMEDKGVAVYACKTCVEHYQLEEKITVGTISSMGHFIELAAQYVVLTIS
jgi:intracellular sulfur oxidation DsrE/DsrF family protein